MEEFNYDCECRKCGKEYQAYRKETSKSIYFIESTGFKCNTLVCSTCFNIGKSCKLYHKTCKHCDKPFVNRFPNKNFCSKKCQSDASYQRNIEYHTQYRINQLKPYFDQDCRICGKIFQVNREDRVICSDKCRKINSKNNRKKYQKVAYRKKNPIKRCLTCGNHVKTASKYCSEDCKPKREPKRCEVCNVAIKGNNKYCPSHKPVYTPVQHNKTCITCGKDYIAKRVTAKYCKRKCSPSEKARRRIAKRKNTNCLPSWVDWDELSKIETFKPSKNHELDHIIPLNHPNVCGLHVPWNLQWLTRSDNQKKSNSFDGTQENISWKK